MPGIHKRSGAENACPLHVRLGFAGPADRLYMSDAYPYAPDDGVRAYALVAPAICCKIQLSQRSEKYA